VPELGPLGSVRGTLSNERSWPRIYLDPVRRRRAGVGLDLARQRNDQAQLGPRRICWRSRFGAVRSRCRSMTRPEDGFEPRSGDPRRL
jgi:hypothetical protein